MPFSPEITDTPASPTDATLARDLAPLFAAALGIVLVYLVGFAQIEALHDGAHNARHSAGFPCH